MVRIIPATAISRHGDIKWRISASGCPNSNFRPDSLVLKAKARFREISESLSSASLSPAHPKSEAEVFDGNDFPLPSGNTYNTYDIPGGVVEIENMWQKFPLELEQARHFLRWVTKEELAPIDKPDCTRPSRLGGHPDYIFRDSEGQEYVLEVTRLLTPELRQLEQFAANRICRAVERYLTGTYILHIGLADPRGKGKIGPTIARSIVQQIMKLVQDDNLQGTQALSTGFAISKVRDDGRRVVPWVTAPELPFDLATDQPVAKDLEGEFDRLLLEADSKFREYGGIRVLLVNASQSGLNLEFHAQRFRASQGVMLIWVQEASLVTTNIDSICLEPGVNVWEAGTGERVLAGHKYIESRAGYYVELWHRPGLPRLLR